MTENKTFNNYEFILLSIVIVYTINLLGVSIYLLLVMIPFVLPVLITINFRKKHVFTILILCIFLFCTIIIGAYYGQFSKIVYIELLLIPIIMYFIGVKLAECDYNYKKTYILLHIIVLIPILYMVLSYLKTISTYGSLEFAFSSLNNRSIIDFWDSSKKPATVVVVYLSFCLAMLPNLFLNNNYYSRKFNLVLKLIVSFGFIVSIYMAVILGSRTSLIIALISLITVHVSLFKFSFRKFMNYIFIFISFVLFLFLFQSNIFGLKTIWLSSPLYQRFQSSGIESSRFQAWEEAISGLNHNPLGGRESVVSLKFAHNLWLDIANDVGVIPFVLLILLTVISITSLLRFIIEKDHPNIMKALLISFYVAFFISFMTEPILRTQERFYFSLFCLIIGLVQGLNSLNKKQKKDELPNVN